MAAIVVDGGGIGGGVIDRLCQLGVTRGLFEFNGGMPANDSNLLQKRAEVWGLMLAIRIQREAADSVGTQRGPETERTGFARHRKCNRDEFCGKGCRRSAYLSVRAP